MALSKPLVDGKTKLKLECTTLGTKRVLLLNKHNFEQIFKVISLTTTSRKYGSTLGGLLDIRYNSQSDPADIYINGQYRSWRRIIFCLDHVDEPSVADELIPYAEPQADPSFTVERVTTIFTKLRNWARIETTGRYIIIVPDARVTVICSQNPSPYDQQIQAAFYYVNCRHNASWSELAGWLYKYKESAEAIKTFKSELPKPQEPTTLTPENVLAELKEVELWGKYESSHYLDMPWDTHDDLIGSHGDGAHGMSALVNEYLSHHPYPRWDQIVGLLEEREKNGKARAGLAEEVKHKYMTVQQ